ncbi:hypothetical protein AMAG_14111 [Allomyces macrogynus ATCC 38327]|uniref:Phosphatidylinositol 3,4,5-trisphosphate 3-phosphatase and dual-specificity protein phosphatase PTEN n=1 Tax=Allomyces macrogynus (strain ATCC 38327) TaxID=578462 RepID=A0A0L0T4U4_ALLM3|nr:hypothetical protein, variant [Allomyces macrogynus ATCC 38327]KNE69550.1 hypothetical protein AMAG_14111 [Allomyces macrogynus ATCC 38327]|eukprot:KNE69549.1 hypothetical protein, variant [Allomyces macrogynus ATCC 38327]
MLNPIRTAVSKKKRRFRGDGFDLDLAYITDRIIAMGYPSESVEGLYRNPLHEVVRFLDLKHKDHYKVYNLCSERCYDPVKFYGRVEHIPFEDHNAPPFELIEVFCRSVQAWLDADAANVAVVHCKAGKGRTGVMICAYLLFSGHSKDPNSAMVFYGRARTQNGHGVTIPSQQRYINYWHRWLRDHLTYTPTERYLTRLTLRAPPGAATAAALGGTHSGVQVTVAAYSNGQRVFAFKNLPVILDPVDPYDEMPPSTAAVPLPHPCRLAGDVRMHLQFELAEKFGKEKPFHFWFNTFFTTDAETVLAKNEIDKLHKDKHHKIVDAEFAVVLALQVPDAALADLATAAADPWAKAAAATSGAGIAARGARRGAGFPAPLAVTTTGHHHHHHHAQLDAAVSAPSLSPISPTATPLTLAKTWSAEMKSSASAASLALGLSSGPPSPDVSAASTGAIGTLRRALKGLSLSRTGKLARSASGEGPAVGTGMASPTSAPKVDGSDMPWDGTNPRPNTDTAGKGLETIAASRNTLHEMAAVADNDGNGDGAVLQPPALPDQPPQPPVPDRASLPPPAAVRAPRAVCAPQPSPPSRAPPVRDDPPLPTRWRRARVAVRIGRWGLARRLTAAAVASVGAVERALAGQFCGRCGCR